MRIQGIELYHIHMPLNFFFKTSQTTLHHRETMIIKVCDEHGNTGYGEVVSFTEPFYSKETLTDSKKVIIDRYMPLLIGREFKHPFDIHEWTDLTYPMAAAGIENALLDLYAKRTRKAVMDVVFAEPTRDRIPAGIALGDMDQTSLLGQIEQYLEEGFNRFKIKIKPEDGFIKLKAIRQKYPGLQLLADANRSYSVQQINELRKMAELDLLCLEEPLTEMDTATYQKLQNEIKIPICLDESIQTMDDLRAAIRFQTCRVVNIKIGRVGGMYYAKQMIELCRKNQVHYWIGSMVESGISKILHVHLASLPDAYIPGDLSPSARYFPRDIIIPEITALNGMIPVPKGWGSGVEIDEELLERYTVEHIIRFGE